MAILLSNRIKALIYIGDINERLSHINKDECYTLQHYEYLLDKSRSRSIDDASSLSKPSCLYFSIRNFPSKISKTLLEKIKENRPSDFSIIFNATFDQNHNLVDYEDSMIVRGYVVDIHQSYFNTIQHESSVGQSLLKISILITRISFQEDNSSHIFQISKD